MLDFLAEKSSTGELYVSKARQLLKQHEWGRARIALHKGILKGGIEDPGVVQELLKQICECSGSKWDV